MRWGREGQGGEEEIASSMGAQKCNERIYAVSGQVSPNGFFQKASYALGVQATWTDHLYVLYYTARLDFPGHRRISSLQCI